ncbi:PAZ domain-containing protein/Piwi domain-containing protein/DUF1785 domain-containing protein [Artemisia annua]|uniref:PAZ domain-containing protein/Piwi domain-containing protein/DUF1785 domain-containing protein n=1 Tax=Artemisia annua TaxID=35608 RepID=A0A2U1KGH7_ARTAN|nr:PAZ domain-containing protein/Piwi domain-containing protein/DUF1785 domain-containing protein [Artemisia annua]
MKINVKVGGTNAILARTIPIIDERPTIIFGAHVTHPQPGEDSSSSIAKVVASMDRHATKYSTLMSAQPNRQEIIEDLYSMIRMILHLKNKVHFSLALSGIGLIKYFYNKVIEQSNWMIPDELKVQLEPDTVLLETR